MRVRRGEWRVDETVDGWELRLRPSLSLLSYRPSRLRHVGWTAAFWLLVVNAAALTGYVGVLVMRHQAQYLMLSLVLCLSLTHLWFMPSRLSGLLGTSYAEGVREVRVTCAHGKVDVPQGMFEAESLRTLRMESGDCLPGRVTLTFDGRVEKHNVLVGWPGLSPDMAEAIRTRVLGFVGEATAGR